MATKIDEIKKSHLYWSAEMWFSLCIIIVIITTSNKEIIERVMFKYIDSTNIFNNISSVIKPPHFL